MIKHRLRKKIISAISETVHLNDIRCLFHLLVNSALPEVAAGDLSGLRLLIQPGSDPDNPDLEEFKKAALDIQPVESHIIGGPSSILVDGDYCCFTLANPTVPWHKYLACNGVIIRPLTIEKSKVTTYLCWRVDRRNPDDLGPVIDLVRECFHVPLDL
ncbi:hypothetical protein [Saccharopolyspora gloriosae]|uniref:hypothetical protein n=1 Tax=Saccharopolyspora gloriosae TaxID=455344 RepID=UPI001FB75E90|nr:hypothetical protein [Saccharopolyspora gloriosae]